MPIRFDRRFTKSFNKTPTKIQSSFQKRLDVFLENTLNPILNNHALTGEYSGCHSINITGDWRAIYVEEIISGAKSIVFVAIGTHSQLYR